jgi:hypothetical protein
MKLFFDLLQNRDQFVKEILDGTGLKHKAMQLGLLSAGTFGLYGLIIGCQNSFRQGISSSVIVTTRHYQFFKLFNVVFFAISGILGIVFVARTQSLFFDDGPQQKSKAAFLKLWFLLYAFVGTQLAWTLRPFFGAPGLRFEIFRGLGGNFYTDIIKSIGHILGPL